MPIELKSTVIISVYKDSVALALIINSLSKQTVHNFEIIVSEDGESDAIYKTISDLVEFPLPIQHLTQTDSSFRKNIALNRAIHASNTEHIIFIDGDCVVHPNFMEAHQSQSGTGIACTGRRVELGEKISNKLREEKISLSRLTNPFLYFCNLIPLMLDHAKNIESGIYSRTLHRLTEDKTIRLLGCNFSCNKQNLININGFNEEYLAPGIGEDSDIDWRLIKSGVTIKNVKFSAIQYHLYHPRAYSPSLKNEKIFSETKISNRYTCSEGLKKNRK